MAVKRVQATVSGQVQGVGYRYFAVHVAQRLGLSGTVRNLPGGDVDVIAEGEESLVNEFLDELKTGPSTAQVRNVQVAWGDPSGQANSFSAVA